jgi:hypothetical protein
MAELANLKGPTGFLRWVVENRFSLDPLVAKHEKVICDMGPYEVCYCHTKGLESCSELVKTAVDNIPTFPRCTTRRSQPE